MAQEERKGGRFGDRTDEVIGGLIEVHRHLGPGLREKPALGSRERPYRRPTRVAGCESTKVDGRTLVKELGKLTP